MNVTGLMIMSKSFFLDTFMNAFSAAFTSPGLLNPEHQRDENFAAMVQWAASRAINLKSGPPRCCTQDTSRQPGRMGDCSTRTNRSCRQRSCCVLTRKAV
jgi:hypothetical protein